MTHGEFIKAMQVLLQRGVTGVSGDAGAISVLLNRSYQFAYQLCFTRYPWFYATSSSFSGTSINTSTLNPKYRKLAVLECPTAELGMIREAKIQQFDYINNIIQEAASASNPLAKVIKDQIIISPSSTGTMYYYRRIPNITLADSTLNITTIGAGDALIHPAFEGTIIAKTLLAAYSRHVQSPDINDAQRQETVKLILDGNKRLNTELEPLMRWKRTIPESE